MKEHLLKQGWTLNTLWMLDTCVEIPVLTKWCVCLNRGTVPRRVTSMSS